MTAASDARFWDKTARRYAASAISDMPGYERTLERTRSFLEPGHQVLELGCGTGTTALHLAGGVVAYTATDISAQMIAIAEDKLRRDPIASLNFRVATAEEMASEGRQFDVVLGFNYLHLVQDPKSTLRAIDRLLKPHGLFISKTPYVGEMNLLIRRFLLPTMRAVGKAPHVSVFNARQLMELIADEGFTVLAKENHASKGRDYRPFVVASKP